MASIPAKDIRKGTLVMYEGAPYRVLSFEHRTPGNLRAFIQAKLRNLGDGTQRDVRFSSSEMLERVFIDAREMDALYPDGDGWVCMDTETYEQYTLDAEALGSAATWLAESMRIGVELLNGRAIGIQLPKTLEIGVKETEPVVKGQTASRSNKPAILDNGVRVMVPPFINVGDRVRVDPTEERYVDRVK